MGKEKIPQKNIIDSLTYAYIRKIKKWMFCPACQKGKMKIDKKSTVWMCEHCGYKLSANEFEDNYVFWFCDKCQIYLNNQEGFNRKKTKYVCRNCGYENNTTFGNAKGICSNCGKIIVDSDAKLCADCRQRRREKVNEGFKTAVKVVAFIGTICLAMATSDDEETDSADHDYVSTDTETGNYVKRQCANCGNTDKNTIWDEVDSIYCSKCSHRTLKATGEEDVVKCPYCHRMRDRKAMYCRHCNDSSWKASTKKEFAEIDKILKEYEH